MVRAKVNCSCDTAHRRRRGLRFRCPTVAVVVQALSALRRPTELLLPQRTQRTQRTVFAMLCPAHRCPLCLKLSERQRPTLLYRRERRGLPCFRCYPHHFAFAVVLFLLPPCPLCPLWFKLFPSVNRSTELPLPQRTQRTRGRRGLPRLLPSPPVTSFDFFGFAFLCVLRVLRGLSSFRAT